MTRRNSEVVVVPDPITDQAQRQLTGPSLMPIAVVDNEEMDAVLGRPGVATLAEPSTCGVTVSLTRSFGYSALRAVVLFGGLWLLLEFVARTPIVERSLQTPGRGVSLPMLDIGLEQSERYIAEEGGVDCIFIGNSTVHRAIDPEQFRRHLDNSVGHSVRALNLTAGGMPPAGKRILLELAMRYRPQVIVYGVSGELADLKDKQRDVAILSQNSWIQHQLGQPSILGWLVDNSRLFQYGQLFRNVADGRKFIDEFVSRRNKIQAVTRCGFVPSRRRLSEQVVKKTAFRLTDSPVSFPGLAEILEHQSRVQIVFLVMPLHDTEYVNLNTTKSEFLSRRRVLADEVKSHAGNWWNIPTDDLPDSCWQDPRHLNASGAAIFTRRLAERFAEAIDEDSIRIRRHPKVQE